MTIVTKPITEKKAEKLALPLVENDQLASAQSNNEDVEAPAPDAHFIFLRARARRVSTTTTLCLLLTGLMVVGVGFIAGTYLYRQYLRSQIFKGWCNIPVDTTEKAMLMGSDEMKMEDDLAVNFNNPYSSHFIQEGFELDIEREEYEKIDVPDFQNGRSGRFIHDFNTNTTGIIDITGQRCFVMPLNRNTVLPPKSLFDLIQKMWDGYYKVNTEIVRETMRVVTPPITDMSEVGGYIARECNGLPIYKLEKYVSGVVKRSAESESDTKFAQFSGNGITEFDIVNFADVEAYEALQKQH